MYNDLLKYLEEYAKCDYVPMHMPGGKKNDDILQMDNPYRLDITEIEGFDNMHNPTGIILEGFKRAALLFGADESYYLVNGSTAGILAAISGAAYRNDKVIMARNCHISVYNAVAVNELEPVYIIPECDRETGIFKGVTLEQVRACYEANKDAKVVILTSPTYEGFVSEIRQIAAYLHGNNVILIVDEAHGAHFNFSKDFPESAVCAGADIVINSIHKTLPSLTQTALMHISGKLVNRQRIRRFWNIYQTTSPSYVLMGSIDRCLSIIEDENLFNNYTKRLKILRNDLRELRNISLLETDDISKIILKCDNGKTLQDILREKYNIVLEMASFRYVIAMTSVMDKEDYYERFVAALREIDGQQEHFHYEDGYSVFEKIGQNKQHFKPSEAITIYDRQGGKEFSIFSEEVCGKINAEPVLIYPPGMPVINSGEEISAETAEIIRNALERGLEVVGLRDGNILCLK